MREAMRNRLALLPSTLAVYVAVACGDSRSPDADSGGSSAGPPSAGTSGPGTSGGGSTFGGSGAASGGSAGSQAVSAGAMSAGGGGASSGAASNDSAGVPSGGGAGGSAAGMSGGSGGSGGSADGCSRELLKSTVDAYFAALSAHDPSALPRAATLKHTENGEVSALGEQGLWQSAGALQYVHSALDTELCMSASQAVIPDGTTDVPVALRLKLQERQIVESELIVARDADYPALEADPAALVASNQKVQWEQVVPADQRATRRELTDWIDKYFRRFPQGVCNTTPDCLRIENGGGNFVCSQGASCASGAGSGQAVLNPRLLLADVDAGLGVGFTIFTGGYIDMHLFKMYGGKVSAVSAVLANGEDSGWD